MASMSHNLLLFCLYEPYLVSSVYSANDVPINVPINVTKHFSFLDFSLTNNSRLVHDLKLLGNAKFSNEKGSLQIPNESQETDIRHQAVDLPLSLYLMNSLLEGQDLGL
ncbi:putative L-type lectin-domain containing receptor kinase-like protein, partial [Trifolium pratense]